MRRGQSGINCLVAIDKPQGLSSHDVVGRVRRAVGERRVGHAGTLDPAATGVLVVGIGQATRLLGLLTADSKAYEAWVEFGSQTDTDDAEGAVVRTAEVPEALFDPEAAIRALASLVGERDQLPPAYSAISVGGQRAYEAARAGSPLELEARSVRISRAELLGMPSKEPLTWHCLFEVSKGTYIRSIARDLGAELGSAAHLSGLRRTSSGGVGLGDCVGLGRLEELGAAGLVGLRLDPCRALGLPTRALAEDELDDVACGRRLRAGGVDVADGQSCCLVHGGRLLGVWERTGGWLRCRSNFPQGIDGVSP